MPSKTDFDAYYERVALTDDPMDVASVETTQRRKRTVRMPRSREPFARVRLSWITDPDNWSLGAPAFRLYCHLLIQSREGRRPVRLSTALTREVGILDKHRHRYLRQLETHCLIAVQREGKSVPIVIVAFPIKGERFSKIGEAFPDLGGTGTPT